MLIKRLRFALLLFVIVIYFIACTSSKTTLRLLIRDEEATYWQPLIQQFEKDNPGVKIELETGSNISNVLFNQYIEKFQENPSYYDLVYLDIIWTAELAKKEWLKNIDQFLTKQEKHKLYQDFFQKDLDAGFYNNQLYRIPLRSDVSLLYYRQDILNSMEQQSTQTCGDFNLKNLTFSNLTCLSSYLKEENKIETGYLWQGRQYEASIAMFVELLKGYGGFWMNESNQIGLTNKPTIETIDFLRNLIKKGVSPKSVLSDEENDTRRKFMNGQVLFLRHWPQAWQWFNDNNSPIRGRVGVTLMPKVNDDAQSWSCQGGWGLGITKNSKHPHAAWKAIQFFTSMASQRQLALGGYIPTRKVLLRDPQLVKKYNHYPIIEKSLNNTVLRPKHPNYQHISDILQNYLHQALNSNQDPSIFMEKATDEIRKILDL
ncbi:ABC transporter substrate-binding protein [Crocosphaera sp.]|uniref:ABC transporter substrate-binding protein n=1 Tax=Crocosphaera sp. TaxID=2729996 RepID=UPI003F21CE60